jgi:hypothetical protein
VFCWAHARRGLFEFHHSTQSPIAAEALARIAALYVIEKDIRGKTAAQRQAERQARSRPLVESMHAWLQQQLTRLSKSSKLAIAIRYVLRHWQGLTYFLDDGRLELDTNTVEREIRPIVLCRKNALFAGNDSGAEHWAIAEYQDHPARQLPPSMKGASEGHAAYDILPEQHFLLWSAKIIHSPLAPEPARAPTRAVLFNPECRRNLGPALLPPLGKVVRDKCIGPSRQRLSGSC